MNGRIFILQRGVPAGAIAPAIDTFVMVGFNDIDDCVYTWQLITHDSGGDMCSVIELKEYLSISPVHRFFDETGIAGLIRKGKNSYLISTLSSLMARLLSRDVLIIDVLDTNEGKFEYSHAEMNGILKVNSSIKDSQLLGVDYRGDYIYMHGSGDGLQAFIDKSNEMYPNLEFLVVYFNSRIQTIQEVERTLWGNPHQAIMLTESAMMQIDIVDKEIKLHLIEEVGEEMIVDGMQ